MNNSNLYEFCAASPLAAKGLFAAHGLGLAFETVTVHLEDGYTEVVLPASADCSDAALTSAAKSLTAMFGHSVHVRAAV